MLSAFHPFHYQTVATSFVRKFLSNYDVRYGILDDATGTYRGNWENNHKHGGGTHVFMDGSQFDGEWHEGLKVQGIMHTTDGDILRVIFNDLGQVVKQERAIGMQDVGWKELCVLANSEGGKCRSNQPL